MPSRGKPCAYVNQALFDHSVGSYDVLIGRGFLDYAYYATVSNRLSKYAIRVDAGEVKRLIELAVKLHDIGKAAEHYQDQFTEDCRSLREAPSFAYHEIGSAMFFYYGDYSGDSRLRRLLTLAALNHLNAIRGLKQLRPNEFPRGFRPGMLKLRRYGGEYLRNLGYSLEVRDYGLDDYTVMMNDLLTHNEQYLKLYNLFLAPIIVGDSLDSHYARNLNEKRRFIALLERELGV